MKILMFGRGVIATFYGRALEQAGHEVSFYVRPGRAAEYGDAIKMDYLDARRWFLGERVRETWPVRYVEAITPGYDLVVFSVQHYRFAEAAAVLAPRLGNATVLVFNNLWVEPLGAIAPFPRDQVVFGFPMAGGGFDADGTLKGSLIPGVFFGTIDAPMTARDEAVRRVFRDAGFSINEQPDFRGWLYLHFILNAGLHARGLQLGSMARMADAVDNLDEGILNIRELLPLVAARGIDLAKHPGDVMPFKAPTWLTAPVLTGLLRHLPLVRNVMETHANPEELRSVCRDTLAEARRLGVPVPRLEAAEPFFKA